MVLARGRGRGKGGISKAKNRLPVGKPPPLMGRMAPPPGMALRPRPPPIPPLVPRMRPPHPLPHPLPPHVMRSPRILPHPIPHVLGPPRPPMPPFHPPPPHGRPLPPPPPPLSLRHPVPPPSLLRARGQGIPPPLMRGPGFRPPGPPMMQKFGPGKRNIMPKGPKKKLKGKKVEIGDESEINKPWVTEAMKNEIQKKQKLYLKAKKNNQQTDWDEFKEQRNRVTTMIREAKIEYIGSHPEEVGDFFCETCDRQFNSSLTYAEHVSEHQTCGLEGCTFTAHPKVVAKHVEMQHLSGLFIRIGKMDSPEDIAKWIADRKRHYPTKENIEKKQAEQVEKDMRGERLTRDRSRFNRDMQNRHRGNDNRRGRGRGRGRFSQGRRRFGHEYRYENEDDDPDEQNVSRGNLRLFPGTRFLEAEDASKKNCDKIDEVDKYSDGEWETSDKMQTERSVVPVASRALSSLMCSYGSEVSDSENDAPMEIPILKSELAASSHVVAAKVKNTNHQDTCSKSFQQENSIEILHLKEISNFSDMESGEHKSSDIPNSSSFILANKVCESDQNPTPTEFNEFISPENTSRDDSFSSRSTEGSTNVVTVTPVLRSYEFTKEAPIDIPIVKTELAESSQLKAINTNINNFNSIEKCVEILQCENSIQITNPDSMDVHTEVSESFSVYSDHSPANQISEHNHNAISSPELNKCIKPKSHGDATFSSAEESASGVYKIEVPNSQDKGLSGDFMAEKEGKIFHVATANSKLRKPKMGIHNSMPNGNENSIYENPNYRRRRKTLLEKLLAKEILHERNVILQCVRYVVDREFFSIGQTTLVKNNVLTENIEEWSNNAKKYSMQSSLLQCIKFIVQNNFLEVAESEKN